VSTLDEIGCLGVLGQVLLDSASPMTVALFPHVVCAGGKATFPDLAVLLIAPALHSPTLDFQWPR